MMERGDWRLARTKIKGENHFSYCNYLMSGLDSHFKDSSSWLPLSADDLWDDHQDPLFSMPPCLDGPTQAIKWKGITRPQRYHLRWDACEAHRLAMYGTWGIKKTNKQASTYHLDRECSIRDEQIAPQISPGIERERQGVMRDANIKHKCSFFHGMAVSDLIG